MNYILQINAFWEKINLLPDKKPYHITLFFALMKINNACGWISVFGIDYSSILNLTRLDKNTYYKSCNYLFENGFLDVYQKGRNQYECAQFSIRKLYDISERSLKAPVTQTEYKQNIPKGINSKILHELSEIEIYFLEKNASKDEALSFFNYNQSKGWKNTMHWKPLADNWISRIKNKNRNKNHEFTRDNIQVKSRFCIGEQDYSKGF